MITLSSAIGEKATAVASDLVATDPTLNLIAVRHILTVASHNGIHFTARANNMLHKTIRKELRQQTGIKPKKSDSFGRLWSTEANEHDAIRLQVVGLGEIGLRRIITEDLPAEPVIGLVDLDHESPLQAVTDSWLAYELFSSGTTLLGGELITNTASAPQTRDLKHLWDSLALNELTDFPENGYITIADEPVGPDQLNALADYFDYRS